MIKGEKKTPYNIDTAAIYRQYFRLVCYLLNWWAFFEWMALDFWVGLSYPDISWTLSRLITIESAKWRRAFHRFQHVLGVGGRFTYISARWFTIGRTWKQWQFTCHFIQIYGNQLLGTFRFFLYDRKRSNSQLTQLSQLLLLKSSRHSSFMNAKIAFDRYASMKMRVRLIFQTFKLMCETWMQRISRDSQGFSGVEFLV